MSEPRGRIIGVIASLALLITGLWRLNVLLRVLLVLSLLALVLLLIWAVSKVTTCRTIATGALDLTCSIVLRDLAGLVWEGLWEGRGSCWKYTLVGRRVIALIVISSTAKVQVETIVWIHDKVKIVLPLFFDDLLIGFLLGYNQLFCATSVMERLKPDMDISQEQTRRYVLNSSQTRAS